MGWRHLLGQGGRNIGTRFQGGWLWEGEQSGCPESQRVPALAKPQEVVALLVGASGVAPLWGGYPNHKCHI